MDYRKEIEKEEAKLRVWRKLAEWAEDKENTIKRCEEELEEVEKPFREQIAAYEEMPFRSEEDEAVLEMAKRSLEKQYEVVWRREELEANLNDLEIIQKLMKKL